MSWDSCAATLGCNLGVTRGTGAWLMNMNNMNPYFLVHIKGLILFVTLSILISSTEVKLSDQIISISVTMDLNPMLTSLC